MHALVGIAAGVLVGAWAAHVGLYFPLAWMGCVALLGIALLLTVSTRRAAVRPARVAAPLFFACGALVGQALVAPPRALVDVPAGVTRVEATVERVRYGAWPSAQVLVHEAAPLDGGRSLPEGARLELSGLDVPAGSRVRVLARLRPTARFENPSPHPEWPVSTPTDGRGRALGRARVDREAPFFERAAHATRAHIRRRLDATLGAQAAALARTLLLGEARALPESEREIVRDAGLSHVLAVSGLHVTLLAGAVVALLRRLILRAPRLARRVDPRRLAHALGVPFALGYALLVGDGPSAWRAAITASIAWGLVAIGRRPRAIATTASAAIVLAALEPDDLARPGFALSIVATAALVTGLGRSQDGDAAPSGLATAAAPSWARDALVIGVRTMLATAPIVLWLFGSVPLVGLLANVVAVPVAGLLLLPANAIHALLAVALPPLAAITAPLCEALGSAFLGACDVFSALELGRDLPPPDVIQGVALTMGCLALLAARRARTRALVGIAAVLAIAGAEVRLRHAERPTGVLRATFLDVGQGDGALIDLPDGRLMVVDAGGATGGGPDPGARVLVPILRARRRARIDVLVISHPHPDHYGGAEALLEAFPIGEIWDTGQAEIETPSGALERLLDRARRRGTRIRRPDELCAGSIALGAARARVLWPCPAVDVGWGPNDNSLVIELALGRRRILLTGDAEGHAEEALLEAELGAVDVLKVAHHGSRTSSAPALLALLRPRIAIASMGRENRFGHPHPDVWARLVAGVPCPFRTDRDGGVIVWTDGDALRAEASAGERTCSDR